MEWRFETQFELSRQQYLNKIDFLNWFRYFHLLKDVVRLQPESLLEVGPGEGLLKNCLQPLVKSYRTLDLNARLLPDVVTDVRDFRPELLASADCVIAADVLEHLPFSDLERVMTNLWSYLKEDGNALITIPHRRSNFLFMTPTQVPHVLTVPTGFLSPGSFYRRFIKRKIWIDPDHCWEIGDGTIEITDVERVFQGVGFTITKFQKLLYVDYWVLNKARGAEPRGV